MVLEAEPVFRALESLRKPTTRVVYLCPDGYLLNPQRASYLAELAKGQDQEPGHLIFLSGHYEGIDQRVRDHAVDLELSIGDYILTNGTLAAAVAIDALCRYLPGVLGEEKSLEQESFSDQLLAFPQYTRPVVYRGWPVPEVLLSGDHGAIARWRYQQRLGKTRRRRPDLFHQHQTLEKTV
jgi:tRNA (guanine37-N1)-methyltransferase